MKMRHFSSLRPSPTLLPRLFSSEKPSADQTYQQPDRKNLHKGNGNIKTAIRAPYNRSSFFMREAAYLPEVQKENAVAQIFFEKTLAGSLRRFDHPGLPAPLPVPDHQQIRPGGQVIQPDKSHSVLRVNGPGKLRNPAGRNDVQNRLPG